MVRAVAKSAMAMMTTSSDRLMNRLRGIGAPSVGRARRNSVEPPSGNCTVTSYRRSRSPRRSTFCRGETGMARRLPPENGAIEMRYPDPRIPWSVCSSGCSKSPASGMGRNVMRGRCGGGRETRDGPPLGSTPGGRGLGPRSPPSERRPNRNDCSMSRFVVSSRSLASRGCSIKVISAMRLDHSRTLSCSMKRSRSWAIRSRATPWANSTAMADAATSRPNSDCGQTRLTNAIEGGGRSRVPTLIPSRPALRQHNPHRIRS